MTTTDLLPGNYGETGVMDFGNFRAKLAALVQLADNKILTSVDRS